MQHVCMPQIHRVQRGLFHVVTNANDRIPWCTLPGVPMVLIDNLVMTKNILGAGLHAFCILPDHVHIVITAGVKGLSSFMHSFKKNSSRDVGDVLGAGAADRSDFRIAAADDVDHVRYLDYVDYPNHAESVERVKPGHDASHIRWQKGYYEERIRTSRQLSAAIGYVQGNAVRHHLVVDQIDWQWTSHHFPHLLDPLALWEVR